MDNMYLLLYESKMEELAILESYVNVNEGIVGGIANVIQAIFRTIFKLIAGFFSAIGNLLGLDGAGSTSRLGSSKYNDYKIKFNDGEVEKYIEDGFDKIMAKTGYTYTEEEAKTLKEAMKTHIQIKKPLFDRFIHTRNALLNNSIYDFKNKEYINNTIKTLFPGSDIKPVSESDTVKIDKKVIIDYFCESRANRELVSERDAEEFKKKFKNFNKNLEKAKSNLTKSYNEIKKESSELASGDAESKKKSAELTKLLYKNAGFLQTMIVELTGIFSYSILVVNSTLHVYKMYKKKK